MSVTVGFSQATTSLIVPAPGTTRPDGTPADGAAQGGGEAGLFAALLAIIAPGAQAAIDDAAATLADTPAVAAVNSIVPPSGAPPVPVAPEAPVLPDLAELPKSFEGKALLKDFADALKAAKAALDEGMPLDPALEEKLRETVDAIAAWFAGQPQMQPTPVDLSKLSELAAGGNILPAAPSTDLPEAADPLVPQAPGEPADIPAPTPSAAANTGGVVTQVMQAQPVPAQLAELGKVLKDFATQLEKVSPDLASAMSRLADRISTGDIADEVMAQLGLTRSLGSTSAELDQLVAALTARPEVKTTAATPPAPIATPVLDVPDIIAGQTAAASVSSEVKIEAKKAADPQPDVRADTRTPETKQPEALPRTAEVKLDTEVKLEPLVKKPSDDIFVSDARPVAPASPKPEAPAAATTPAPDAAAQGAQVAQAAAATAATATRAIHAAYSAPVQQLNYPQVAFEVARQFEAGNTRFQIRLDPADLGRIDVKLDLDKSGTVSAHMFVERPETLDLMMRDQRALQQALQQAGLDGSKTSLEFSLRQNPFGTGADTGQRNGGDGQPGFGPFGTPATDEATEVAAQALYRGSASQSGLNLFV